MSQKRSETSVAQSTQWHLMAVFQKSTSASCEKPPGLSHDDGKRPDGVTLLPWTKGKPLAWDVSVPDTYADSHLADTATTAGAAADKAASNKEAKYRQLANSHIFVPVAIETWNNRAVKLVQELHRRMTGVTEDTRETTYLSSGCRWLSNGEMRSLSPPSKRRCGLTCLVFNILPSGI